MKKIISAVLFAVIILAIVIAFIYFKNNKTTKQEVMTNEVKTTILKQGTGAEAVNGSIVSVHYTG
jgi:FKBP-type peptidyl-prolyl cis-trans isomerase